MEPRLRVDNTLRQTQRLILSPQMQQALHLLQLPVTELVAVVNQEMTENPLLDMEEDEPPSFLEEFPAKMRLSSCSSEEDDPRSLIESTLPTSPSLQTHLLQQAREAFPQTDDYSLAEIIIGSLDDSGFLMTSQEELGVMTQAPISHIERVIETIQTFDPKGIAASSLQQSLLIQLAAQGKRDTLAYRIVQQGWDPLLKNQIRWLAKQLSASSNEVYTSVARDIAPLDFHPGKRFGSNYYPTWHAHVVPDILIDIIEDKLVVEVNQGPLPALRISPRYMELLYDPQISQDVKSYLHQKMQSSQWLLRNLHERQHTLARIADKLVEIQKDYFERRQGHLVPLTMKQIAQMLDLHESTVTRAVAHKYISSPRGVFLLRDLFTNAYTTCAGDIISADVIKGHLQEIVDQEDRNHPLSDEIISARIKEKGILCARRTIAKYRTELGIGNAAQRRLH